MTDTEKKKIHKTLLELPLPWDVVRIVKMFVGNNYAAPVSKETYDDYKINFRARHKKRAFTF